MTISILDSPMASITPQAATPHAVPNPQKRMKRSPRPRRFGVFRNLPAEIRLHIWHYLMPEFRNDDEPSLSREAFGSPIATPVQRHGNRFAILRTSRALKNEIEAELYRLRTLTFTIRPQWRGWRVENLPGSTMTDFVRTDFKRFKSIKVDIYCPQRGDSGQLLYARASIYNLVRLLRGNSDDIEQCEPYSTRDDQTQLYHQLYSNCMCDEEIHRTCAKIPRMEVTFLDEGSNTWNENEFPHVTFWDTPWLYDDLNILIDAFGYLHMVESISFAFPKVLRSDSCANHVRTVQRNVTDFLRWGWGEKWNETPKTEAERFLGLDWALDRAPGPAAAILRRERIIHNRWYRQSVERFLDLYVNRRKYHNAYLAPTLERYRDFAALDRSYLDHGWKLHITKDPKWLEEWRRYWPSGIPPKGSAGWNALIASASRY